MPDLSVDKRLLENLRRAQLDFEEVIRQQKLQRIQTQLSRFDNWVDYLPNFWQLVPPSEAETPEASNKKEDNVEILGDKRSGFSPDRFQESWQTSRKMLVRTEKLV